MGLRKSKPEQPPVRVCCGQRHWGVVCRDGTVMCQLCFAKVDMTRLYVDDTGWCWDVCQECADSERLMITTLAEINDEAKSPGEVEEEVKAALGKKSITRKDSL